MRPGGTAALLVTLLLAVPACGGSALDSDPGAPPETSEETTAAPEEEKSACRTAPRKGKKIKVVTTELESAAIPKFVFSPKVLKLDGGEFVTIRVTNKHRSTHTFTIDSVDCDTDVIPTDESVTVSFRVPQGTTRFYCIPHEQLGMEGKIVAK